ncbi:MAG TPA: hypothetical protein VLU25_20420 [Acidobacteriota bacterium]|nr:hypothetical protein [Acidobacteriota bacterium]
MNRGEHVECRRHDFFVRHLMGVDPPGWNSGLTLKEEDQANPAQNSSNGAPSPHSFNDPSPYDPPLWWW